MNILYSVYYLAIWIAFFPWYSISWKITAEKTKIFFPYIYHKSPVARKQGVWFRREVISLAYMSNNVGLKLLPWHAPTSQRIIRVHLSLILTYNCHTCSLAICTDSLLSSYNFINRQCLHNVSNALWKSIKMITYFSVLVMQIMLAWDTYVLSM